MNTFSSAIIEDIKSDFNLIVKRIRHSENGGVNKYLQQSLYNSFLKTEFGKFLISNKIASACNKDELYTYLLSQIPKCRGERNIQLWNKYEEQMFESNKMKEFLDYLSTSFIEKKNPYIYNESEKNMKSHFVKYTTKRLLALFSHIRITQASPDFHTLADLYELVFKSQLKLRLHKKTDDITASPKYVQEKNTESEDFDQNTSL